MFKTDLIPYLKSRKAAEVLDEEDPLSWEREGKEESVWLRFAFLAGFALVAFGVIAAVVWFIANRKEPVAMEPAPTPDVQADAGGRALENSRDGVMELVSEFVGATTLEDKLKWVLPVEGVEEKMGRYYTRHPAKAQQIYDFPLITITQRVAGNFYSVRALTVDNQLLDFAVPVTTSGPKIAWEAHVGYCEVDWEDFLEQRPSEAVEMRVYAQPATHYVRPFDDMEEYLSVELTRPKSGVLVFGFLSKSSTEGLALMKRSMLSGKPEPLVLMLRYPDATRPNVLVDACLQAGWFTLGSDYADAPREEDSL